MEFRDDLKYSEFDEWIRVEEDIGIIGITDFAQDELSDIVYFEVTGDKGKELAKGVIFGVVESVKAASDLYMPVSGEILEVNEALYQSPEQMNSSPYDAAWLIKVRIADPSELDALIDVEAYKKNVEERSG